MQISAYFIKVVWFYVMNTHVLLQTPNWAVVNSDSKQGRLGQLLSASVCSDCVSLCSAASSCGAVCCGAKSHCWEPQWKRSIVHIPATWDSSVSVILHSSIDAQARSQLGWDQWLNHSDRSACVSLCSPVVKYIKEHKSLNALISSVKKGRYTIMP